MPEGEKLKHIKSERNTYSATLALFGFVFLEEFKFILIYIKTVIGGFFRNRTLTAVSGYEFTSVTESIDCKAAVVAASAAVYGAYLMLEFIKLFFVEYGGFFRLAFFLCI